jgi:2-polyprenyl-6-hydroxyphenyl methylase/3-demethylubiquinone-9 3-methyltransferase
MRAAPEEEKTMAVIDNDIYNRIPATWWNEDGFMAILRTAINPPRFAYFQRRLAQQWPGGSKGLTVLDVGCGGGYLSEQFAAIGCAVTGIDQSLPTLAAAREHAAATGLAIDYREASADALPFAAASFDVVCCCDVLEHVDDVSAVIAEISRVLKPGGIFFFDTINRTLRSRVLAIKLAQDWPLVRFMPRDVHVFEKFIRPDELAVQLNRHGLGHHAFAGLSPLVNPLRLALPFLRHKLGSLTYAELGERLRFGETRDLSVSYMGYALRSGAALAVPAP